MEIAGLIITVTGGYIRNRTRTAQDTVR